MARESVSNKSDVVLGLDAARGFAPPDQTSPALAAAADALVDTTTFSEPGFELFSKPVTELRIHGVSGSDGPTMLEHPHVLQVAGDSVAGFYRRWSPGGRARPSVPWKAEAYSWGGLTEAPLASASWLLLAPFMMYNVAYFMLPPTKPAEAEPAVAEPERHLRRDRGHLISHVLLRLLAMAATVQFVAGAATVMMSTVAWQAAGLKHSLLPSWMGWYGRWTEGWRVAVAMVAVGAIIAAVWWISVKTASKYEGRVSNSQPDLNDKWPLTERGFWKGQVLVGRQRALHAAAACASVALIGALPPRGDAGARWSAIVLAGAALAAAVVTVTLNLADRYTVTVVREGKPKGGGRTWWRPGLATWWCRIVLLLALAALVTSAWFRAQTYLTARRHAGALPGLTPFLGVLLAVQAGLLVLLAVTVAVLARRARRNGLYGAASADADKEKTGRPYLRGGLTALVAALGFALGGLLTAVLNFGVIRLLGTPEPSGYQFGRPPLDALVVPWPTYAFGAAPLGLAGGGLLAGIVLGIWYKHRMKAAAIPGPGFSPVHKVYAASTALAPGYKADADDTAYATTRKRIGAAWAVGRIADDAATAVLLVVGVCLLLVLAVEIILLTHAGISVLWKGAASFMALVAVAVAGWLVTLLRQAYSDQAKRKTIGMLWDVGTFWPRAVHPFAPPCYAERAVPEVVDRIRLLTGHFTDHLDDVANLKYQAGLPDPDRPKGLTVPAGRLLLTGYSQGSIIAPAVVAQLGPKVLPDVALLTLACPARRLYGRAFPAYFGQHQLIELAGLLGADEPSDSDIPDELDHVLATARWRNLRRRSDYIGSWIFGEPESPMPSGYLHDHVDQPCLDPVVLVQDENPTPPAVHRHSQWWQDPRTNELGRYLIEQLLIRQGPRFGQPAAAAPPPDPVPATASG